MNKPLPPSMDAKPYSELLLALTPLLIMSSTAASALFLGLLSYAVLILSALFALLIPRSLNEGARLLLLVFVPAVMACIISLLLAAYHSDAFIELGILVPLIATNGLLLLPLFASEKATFAHQHRLAILFFFLLMALATVREVLATGSLFSDIATFFGQHSQILSSQFWQGGLALAQLAPGAFILLGLLLALFNVFTADKKPATTALIDSNERRARVTGRIA